MRHMALYEATPHANFFENMDLGMAYFIKTVKISLLTLHRECRVELS